MGYLMLRSFDHAGYYETRLVLMKRAGIAACYRSFYSTKDMRMPRW
jgi:hypothetical protein